MKLVGFVLISLLFCSSPLLNQEMVEDAMYRKEKVKKDTTVYFEGRIISKSSLHIRHLLSFLSHFQINLGGGLHNGTFTNSISGTKGDLWNIGMDILVQANDNRAFALELNRFEMQKNGNGIFGKNYSEVYSIAYKIYFDWFNGDFYPSVHFGLVPLFLIDMGYGLTISPFDNFLLTISYRYLANGSMSMEGGYSLSTHIVNLTLNYNFDFLP